VDQVWPVLPNRLIEPMKQTHVPAHAPSCEVHGNAQTGELVQVEVMGGKADYMAFEIGFATESFNELYGLPFLPAYSQRFYADQNSQAISGRWHGNSLVAKNAWRSAAWPHVPCIMFR